MNFAPRREKPRLITYVSDVNAMEDATGLVHYVNAIGTVMRVACKTGAVTRAVDMRPVTCLECLCLNIA